MSFKGKVKTGGDGASFDIPPADQHPAVCVAIIDLGTQPGGDFEDAHKVLLVWELLGVKVAGSDRNHVIGRDYTVSYDKKANLRKLIDAWIPGLIHDGQEYDIADGTNGLLGRVCLLNVAHKENANGKTDKDGNPRKYAQISSIGPVPKMMEAGMKDAMASRQIKNLVWEIESGEPFPDATWMPFIYGRPAKEVMEDSEEWRGRSRTQTPETAGVGTESEQETPF